MSLRRANIYLTHCSNARALFCGFSGETATLWTILKEFCVQELVTLIRQLAYGNAAFGKDDESDNCALDYPTARGSLFATISDALPVLDNLGLKISLGIAEDFLVKLGRHEIIALNNVELGHSCYNLYRTIQRETEGIICFKTDDTYIRIFDGDEPLSNQVADRFLRAVQEIREAAKCLLFDRSTACVFHSMRAIEVALKAVWKTLEIHPPKLSDSWGELLKPLGKQLACDPKDRHPVWQANLDFFSEVVADIRAAKRSYRDSTMHVESTYTAAEARAIFNSTKTLIAHTAKRLDQEGNFLPE
jgi:hypothetical protein